ncbi:MAG: hypothetical protein ACXVDA_24340 [Ktedonobacterales bacterium]
MSTSEYSEYAKDSDLQDSRGAKPSDESTPLPGSGDIESGNRDTPRAIPPGYDNTNNQYEPERRVSQGGKTDNPDLAEVLAETDTLAETTYPDATGTIQETEWVGQGGELDDTVQESRVGLDRLEGQSDAPGAPDEEGNVMDADSGGEL